MRICNACRYCEGFCAVFPAMERRLDFSEPDVNFLANLCHDCGECYYSCQYAPPHEFAVNLPQTLSAIRRETYRKYTWPAWCAGLFRRNSLVLILAAVVVPLALFLVLQQYVSSSVLFSSHLVEEGSFYQVMPHSAMIAAFGSVGLLILMALMAGFLRFWRETGEPLATLLNPAVLSRAISDTLRLRYLDGGGESGGDGCAYPSEVPSHARRWFHHLTFYGFLLCFAATTVAAIYHNFLGWEAPYAWLSLPVILGSLGGAGLLIGPVGLLWLKRQRDADLESPSQAMMDIAFLAMLFLTSLTGFLLLLLRESAAMGTLLAAHLGIVMGLFLTIPYGKFVHAIYRFGALLRNASEERRAKRGLQVASQNGASVQWPRELPRG
ncbi:MAG: tricarballylate utilization 4Fe-4S protein TcuB [Acidobacteria bacterium]|nr:tricarballylate utilization 4Fe-4S protein TcuB [Acidobacteriota bacterium]